MRSRLPMRPDLDLLVGSLICLALVACSRKPHASTDDTVRVDGSSTVFLISESQAKAYQRAGFGLASVSVSGTSGGFRKFCAGQLDVAGASRPINRAEMDTCKKAGIDFIELPIGYDGISIVVNPKNTWVDSLTVAELKAMWEPGSKVKSWRDIRNTFPDRPLHLFGPGSDSGTYDYFTLAINGAERAIRSDYTGSEDDFELVNGVAADEGGLAVFGYAYYVENWNRLKLLAVDDGIAGNGDGPIRPSQETVSTGTYQPLTRPMFIYVSTRSLQRRQVEHFVSFYLSHARQLVADAGYIALPQRGDDLAKERFKARKTGSVFSGGSQLGVTVEKLLAAEAKE